MVEDSGFADKTDNCMLLNKSNDWNTICPPYSNVEYLMPSLLHSPSRSFINCESKRQLISRARNFLHIRGVKVLYQSVSLLTTFKHSLQAIIIIGVTL